MVQPHPPREQARDGRFTLLYLLDIMTAKMLGKRIKARRLELGMTQIECAKRAGIVQPYLLNLEHGRRDPTLSTLVRIAKALKVSLSDLFG